MEQKIVLKVPPNGEKGQATALRIAVCVPGVISASVKGADKDLIVVKGEDIDLICLEKRLREKLGHAELIKLPSLPGVDSGYFVENDLQSSKDEIYRAYSVYNPYIEGPGSVTYSAYFEVPMNQCPLASNEYPLPPKSDPAACCIM